MLKAVLISLGSGALATSLAEYLLGYNLVDYIKDAVLGLLGRIRKVL